jgi:uncharacterized protein YegP (UPF0339 family)
MKLRVTFYKDTAGEFRWTAQNAGNFEVVGDGEGYKNSGDCENTAQDLFPEATFIWAENWNGE